MVTTLLLLFAQFVPGAPMIPWGGTDFLQYYAANQLLLEGKNPYDRDLNAAKQESFGRVARIETYTPPWGFLPALPLSWFSFVQAVQLNIALNGIILAVSVFCWTRLFFPAQKLLVIFTLGSLPLWLPCMSVVGMGQLSLWPLLGFTGWLWFTVRSGTSADLARWLNSQVSVNPTGERRSVSSWTQWFAGACLALLIVKPHLGLLLGVYAGSYVLRQRQWRAVCGFIAAFVLATFVTLLLRPTIWSDYLHSVQTSPSLVLILPATLEGGVKMILGKSLPAVTWTVWSIALLLAGYRGWRCAAKQVVPQDLISWSAIMSIVAVAVVPYAFSFDFVLMLPGFVLAIGLAVEKQVLRWRLPILGWLALEFWLVYGKLAPWSESSYCLIPWVGLAVTIWLLRHEAICARKCAVAQRKCAADDA